MTLAPDGGDWFDWAIAVAEHTTENDGLKVVEQCNRCHCEVPFTVSGTCPACVVTYLTEPYLETG